MIRIEIILILLLIITCIIASIINIENFEEDDQEATADAATNKTLPTPPPLPGDEEPIVINKPEPVVKAPLTQTDILNTSELLQQATKRNNAAQIAFTTASTTLAKIQTALTDIDTQTKKYSGEVLPADVVYTDSDNQEIQNRTNKMQTCLKEIETIKVEYQKSKESYNQVLERIAAIKEYYDKYTNDTNDLVKLNNKLKTEMPLLKNKINTFIQTTCNRAQ